MIELKEGGANLIKCHVCQQETTVNRLIIIEGDLLCINCAVDYIVNKLELLSLNLYEIEKILRVLFDEAKNKKGKEGLSQ